VRPRHTGVLVALVATGTLLIVSGLLLAFRQPRADAPDIGRPRAVAAASSGTATAPSATPTVPGPTPTAPERAGAPTGLVLPGATRPVPLVAIGALPSGALALPDRPTVVGWWAAGAVPGDPAGTAVIAGHIDSAADGAGPLRRLLDLRLGDVIQVTDAAGGRHAFALTSRTTYRKRDLPPDLFQQDGPARLALITCGGAFDRRSGSYADNVVVLAAPVTAATSSGP
jgi:hypothetical protein